MHLFDCAWGWPLHDCCNLCRIHADAMLGDQEADEGHLRLVELTLLNFGIQLVFAQDCQDAADVRHVLRQVLRVDDDIIEDADADEIQVFPKDVMDEALEHRWSVGDTHGTDPELVVAFPAAKGGLPLVPLPHPHLMVGIAQVDFCEDLGLVQAVEHLGNEGQGVSVFDGDVVETSAVHHEAKLPIRTLNKHHWSSSRRHGRPDKTILQVGFNILFHGSQLDGRLRVDFTPRWLFAWLQLNSQIVLAVRGKGIRPLFREDVEKVVIFGWNLGEKVGVGRRGEGVWGGRARKTGRWERKKEGRGIR